MSGRYRALFAQQGAYPVAVACVAGWLSFATYGFAIVLAARAATGSFAVAGAASAGFAAGSALLAPLRGRAVDRHGGRALAAFGVAHGLAMAGLVVGCAAGSAWLVAAAVAGGATTPPVIGTARAVWTRVAGPDLARTGHAVNAALGDGAGVAGPALVGGLAALVSPVGALALVLPGAVTGALLLARMIDRAGPAAAQRAGGWLGPLRTSAGLRTLVAADLTLGVVFGAVDVAAPALAARESAATFGAVPLAALALTSVAAAVWAGARGPAGAAAAGADAGGACARRSESARGSGSAAERYVGATVLVAVALAPAPLVPTLAGLSLLALVAGLGLGALNVALFELLDVVVDVRHAVEALTWLTSLQGLGLALGAAAAGALAQRPTALMTVVAAPAVAGAAIVVARRGTLVVS